MSLKSTTKRRAYPLIAVGLAFFALAISGRHAAFYAIGIVFVALGAASLRQARGAE